MSAKTLYLTRDEETFLKKYAPTMWEGWTIEEETLNTYEENEELQLRHQMLLEDEHFQQFRGVIAMAKNNADVDHIMQSLQSLPRDVFLEMMFALGAKFLKGYIGAYVSQIHTQDDMQSLEMISQLRHSLLEANSEHNPK